MPREAVVFKGSRQGVSIFIDETADFGQVLSELRRKLAPAREFFAGAVVRVQAGERSLLPQEREELARVVQDFGLELVTGEGPARAASGGSGRGGRGGRSWGAERALLIRRTLRSGQRVDHDGHVVILGDVNPGAVVNAAGDIVVLGALRGVAHAGAAGDTRARVVAFRLEPTQLRIAQYISRAPDGRPPRPSAPEAARVKDEMILIEAYVP